MRQRRNSSGMFWGAVLILFGVLFLLDNFYILDFSELIHDFWPLILVAIGIKILYDRSRQPADDDVVQLSDQPPAMDGDRSSSDSLSESNVFGDIDLRITSDKFRGGSVNNVFGDIRLDISQVQLAAGTTKVFISGIFGDITVVTPKDLLDLASRDAVDQALTRLVRQGALQRIGRG